MSQRHEHGHTASHSRSAGCRTRFLKDSTRYLAAANRAAGAMHPEPPVPLRAQGRASTIYTCPMHPEVRQIGPGHCPKCGMALEPLMPTASEDDSEVRNVHQRFWIALALAIPVMLIAMVPSTPSCSTRLER